ncbi:MAG: hypothetical protein PGN12_01850 [Sphingomonas phyllosphaerae]
MAVLPDGSLGLMATDVDLSGAWARVRRQETEPVVADLTERPQAVAARGTARLWRFDGKALHVGPTVPLESPSLALARFPDGRWLIAATNGHDEPNGRFFAPDGTLLARIHLGDAIEYLAVDLADRIWVGWFDEGILGNMDRFPETIDRTAMVAACFAADGATLPVGPVPEDVGFLADVYAMTVTEDGAWVCPYTEFPLLYLRPGQPARWWRNELSGVNAIATDGRYALLAGGYGDDAARLALVELGGDGQGEEVGMLASWRLPLVERISTGHEHSTLVEHFIWERPALLTGRGDVLHLVRDGIWYRWRVADAVGVFGRT